MGIAIYTGHYTVSSIARYTHPLAMSLSFTVLLCLLSAVSARQVALRDFSFGFCDEDTPQPLSIEVATIDPFPIPLVTGTILDVNVRFILNEICPVGTLGKMNMELQGLIPIPIPCVQIGDISLGSCEYGIDALLTAGSALLCPTLPVGQDCNLPLNPGSYGGEIVFEFPEINPIIAELLAAGTYKIDAQFLQEDGTEFTCLTFNLELTGSP